MKELNLYIRNVRKEKKLTLQDLHNLSGISVANLSKIECGQTPTPIVLGKIVKALDCDIDKVFDLYKKGE